MIDSKNKPNIKVWDFQNKNLEISPTGKEILFNSEQKNFIEKSWKDKKKKGWADSWIATIRKINFSKKKIKIISDAIKFSQVNGWLQSIENNLRKFPEVVPSISIGIFPVTSDGFLIFARRNLKELHAPGVWNIPGGYMNSLLVAGKENCSDSKYKKDKKVFSIKTQAELRAHKQEFYGLSKKEIKFSKPFALALGTYQSHEYEIALVGKLKKTKSEMKKHIRQWEFVKGLREHIEVKFVGIKDLEKLLENQIEIYKKNPIKYKSKKNIFILDDNIGELLGGGYEKISGKKLDKNIVEKLKEKLKIEVVE